MRILHVDDEPDFADLTATYLERTMDSFTVDTAIWADEVITDRPRDTYDCIISDYDMPGLNGLKFRERIREDASKLPFPTLSAHSYVFTPVVEYRPEHYRASFY
ncbi:response regulator [Haloarcula japonica]|uniref:HTR-like protein n=1 Tax=Haloarcula japonica (strain ATCC 49778 / DSM 6131 / JCM 7785 / NBRC 101032 / NCIMB 13157 / TR-1) TaxID=1227453 RepID=M0L999_HALJT|nr:response regulator [Haloarcula japonica]EMA29668.1 HTR-like protein [Haloarcula japonica DSM 6131]